jgi:hypothetical protein
MRIRQITSYLELLDAIAPLGKFLTGFSAIKSRNSTPVPVEVAKNTLSDFQVTQKIDVSSLELTPI